MLKVLHAGNLLCVGVFIMRAGFRSPLLRSLHVYVVVEVGGVTVWEIESRKLGCPPKN